MQKMENMLAISIIFTVLVLRIRQHEAVIIPVPEGCGATYTNEAKGTISSPGYPDKNYPPFSNCTYTVVAPTNNVIAYQSTFMKLEKGDEQDSHCVYDRVMLYDGDDSVGSYCGNKSIYLDATKTTTFRVTFESDFQTEAEGFSIEWYILNPATRKPSMSCNFDGALPLCAGWNNVNAEFPWIFTRGRSPSDNTGPTKDHTTNSERGRYAFIEASNANEGTTATLESPAILTNALTQKRCLSFWYHMFGIGTGNLTVSLDQTSGETEIIKLEGAKRDAWIKANRTLTITGLFATVSFKASVGSSFMSDIAIDDIEIMMGPCGGDGSSIGLPINVGNGRIPIAGGSIGIINLVPEICPGNMIKLNCPSNCELTCEAIQAELNACSRSCNGECACPLDLPLLQNGRCVDNTACPTVEPIRTTTVTDSDFEKRRKAIREELVGDFIKALLAYINATNAN